MVREREIEREREKEGVGKEEITTELKESLEILR